MKAIQYLIITAASLGLLGCAAMNESECRVGDWYGTGLRDGQWGAQSRIADYAESCQKLGITPNLNEYTRGRDQGLRTYCTPDSGYRAGRAGNSYGNVCPSDLQAGFLSGYERGYARYRLERDIDQYQNQLLNYRSDRKNLEDKIAKAATEDERRKLLRDLDRLSRQQMYSQQQLDQLLFQQANWRD